MIRLRHRVMFVVVLVFLASAAWAQVAGTIAAVEGTVEIGRVDAWKAAEIGTELNVGDELRTREGGRASVVLQDSSVVNVGIDTLVGVDKYVFDPAKGLPHALLRVPRGKVRALVTPDYSKLGASYEIETPTAVSSVRGTEFVIAYDPVADVTEVLGIAGKVTVNSVVDRSARGVAVTAQNITTVARGQLPTAPIRLEEKLFRQYLEDFEFIGGGRPESMVLAEPLLSGSAVPAEDRAASLPALEAGGPVSPIELPPDSDLGLGQDASSLLGQPPASVETTGDLGIEF